MLLRTDENPNCEWIDGRVYNETEAARPITHVLRQRQGKDVWCEITGLDDDCKVIPALARKVQDSGDGICYLVYGGAWGVRIKEPGCTHPWSLDDSHQWGEAFLLLPSDGEDLRF